jgi:hypothetical protein
MDMMGAVFPFLKDTFEDLLQFFDKAAAKTKD